MTRLLVIGSSHVGALKQAEPAFRAAFPSVDIGYFAAPSAMFFGGRVDKAGVFNPKIRKESDHDLSRAINGATTANLNDWDEILAVGLMFGLNTITYLLLENDLLEGARTGRERFVSDAFLEHLGRERAAANTKMLFRKFGKNHRLTLMDAPYPAASISDLGDQYLLGQNVTNFSSHPDAPRLFDRFYRQMDAAVTEVGYKLLLQPDETIAAPFATKSHYALGALHPKGEEFADVDHRHMNGEFGMAVLTQYARQYLNLEPQSA